MNPSTFRLIDVPLGFWQKGGVTPNVHHIFLWIERIIGFDNVFDKVT